MQIPVTMIEIWSSNAKFGAKCAIALQNGLTTNDMTSALSYATCLNYSFGLYECTQGL